LSFILILLRLFLLTANQNQASVHSDLEQTQGHEVGTTTILIIISRQNAAKGYFRTEIAPAGFYLCRTGVRFSINGEKSHRRWGKKPRLCSSYCLQIYRPQDQNISVIAIHFLAVIEYPTQLKPKNQPLPVLPRAARPAKVCGWLRAATVAHRKRGQVM
jgi:hypothetical protein